MKISTEVRSLQYARAKNEVYLGICAAIGGGESQETLMAAAGSFLIEDKAQFGYTEEEYRLAEERMMEIQRQRELAEKTEGEKRCLM